jgi:type II restriction enzyme MunI
LAAIYTPPAGRYGRHGIIPDFAIDNLKTKKPLYVEVKRQDGWVEGKEKSAGRGNAHERSCKFFTPGLLKY